jgi:hypothetical protein
MNLRLPGWDSPKTVAKLHSFFETLESLALAAAIVFELSDFRRASNIFWVVLVVADIAQRTYGWRDKKLSEIELAEARERQGVAEKELNELSSARRIDESTVSELAKALTSYAGTRVDVFIFDGHILETLAFASRLREVFVSAGWKVKVWHATGASRMLGASLSMGVRADQYVREGAIPAIQRLMYSLCATFSKLGIECTSMATGFDHTESFSAWEMVEHASWDLNDVAPLRIQVCAKQHIPLVKQLG